MTTSPILQERGLFWWNDEPLPDNHFAPPSSVGGLLTIEADHISLKLDGMLPDQPNIVDVILSHQDEKIDRIIQGILLTSGKRVLLPELIRYGGQLRTNAPSTQDFVAFECLIADAAFPAGGRPKILSMIIDLAGLQPWFASEPITVKREKTGATVTVTYTPQVKASYELGNETIEINFGPGIKRNSETATVSLSDVIWLVHSSSEPTQLDRQTALFSQLNDFFILLTGRDFTLPRPKLKIQGGPNCEFYLFRDGPKLEDLNQKECWTTFPKMRQQFGDLWQRWGQLREYSGPGTYLYLATLRRQDLYPEHHFVNLIWGLEAFHRKKDNPDQTKTSVVERIQRILDQIKVGKDRTWLKGKLKHAAEPILEERIAFLISSLPILGFERKAVRGFATKCAKLRNDISHFGGNRDASYSDFLNQLDLYSRVLSKLYHYLILHEIGVDSKLLNEWIERGPRSYVARQEFIAVGLLPQGKRNGQFGEPS